MLIDTHTHYNFADIKKNWREHWQLAQAKGVTHAIQIGTDLATAQAVIDLANQEPNFFATVGVHPHDLDDFDLNQLEQLAAQPKVIAIGEIGLDYFRLDRTDPQTAVIKTKQQQAFIAQLELAKKLNLPISVHVRDDQNEAYQDVLDIFANQAPTTNFVLHCVSGPDFYIKAMIDRGAWFGFDGNITYKNADRIREIVQQVPKHKVVIETDAPFLPPMPHRGKICEPWMLILTANYLEENFGLSREQLAENSVELFPGLK